MDKLLKNKKLSFWLSIAIIISFILVLGIWFISQQKIMGYDGFYHLKKAALIGKEGLKANNNNWLTQTVLADNKTDHHFLFHILLIPFTLGKNLIFGASIFVVFNLIIFFTGFFIFLYKHKVAFPLFFTFLLLLGSASFLYRISFVRAPLLGFLLFLLISYLMFKKKWIYLGIISAFFVLFYGTFPFAIIYAFLFSLAYFIVKRKIIWQNIIATLGGIIGGLVINPFFPQNLNFYYWHFSIPFIDIPKGGEWNPLNISDFAINSYLILVFLLLAITALFLIKKHTTRSIFFFLVLLFAITITLNSQRFVDFLVPSIVLFSAFSISDYLRERNLNEFLQKRNVLTALTIISFIFLLSTIGFVNLKKEMEHIEGERSPERYKRAAEWLKNNSKEGEIVFNTDWDDFPELFFWNSHNRYIVGLDPTFLYLKDKKLYQEYVDITLGNVAFPAKKIKEDFDARYIFTDTSHNAFINQITPDKRAKLKYSDERTIIYAISE